MGHCQCARCGDNEALNAEVNPQPVTKLGDEEEVLHIFDPSNQSHRLRGVSVYHLGETLLQEIRSLKLDRTSSVRDIEPVYIRSFGVKTKCRRDGRMGAAYVDCLSDACAARSDFMLSYTWDYSVGDIVDTLANFCERRGLREEATYIWICCLCVNQHRVQEMRAKGEFVSFEDLEAAFGESVKTIGKIICMMTPWTHPSYLNRVWCCYEIFRAIDWKVEVSIAMPPSEGKKFCDAARNITACKEAFDCFRKIDIESAQSFSPSDKTSILELVRSSLGIDKVNSVVKEYMQRWVLGRVLDVLDDVISEEDIVLACRLYADQVQFIGQVSFAFRAQVDWRKNFQLRLEEEGKLNCTALGVLCLYMRWVEELFADDYDSMESTIAEMVEARDKCNQFPDMCNSLIAGAQAFLAMNRDKNYAEARDCFEKALMYLPSFDSLESGNALNLFRLVGVCKKNLGDVDMALLDFEKTLALHRKLSMYHSPFCALLLRNMGDALASRGELQKALEKYEEAIAIRASCGTLQCLDGANLLESIASVKEKLGDHEAAEESMRESRSTRLSHRTRSSHILPS